MAQLNLRVGASVDRNLGVAFRPLVEGAKKAKAAIEAESKAGARAISRETKKGVDEAEKKFRELEAEVMTGMPRAMNAGTAAVKAFAKETSQNFNAVKRNFNDLAKEAEAAMRRIDREAKKNAGQSLFGRAFEAAGGGAGVRAGLSRSGRAALGVTKAAAGAAFSLASSVARGAGVETDMAALFRKNTDLETLANQVSNSGYIVGDKRNNTRVDPRTLMEQALKIGADTGTDANTALEGLSKFVSKTGDLATGRELMRDLAVYAKATGTSLEDMTDAAGDVASALPEGADKGKQILSVMRAVAGQGKLGAVEMKDLASQMAKIAAQAGQFQGDAADNIITLGAMAQESRQRGGSASAREATQSISSWVGMLKTPKRAKEFEKATGAKVFDEKTGMLRDSRTIIKEALSAVGMDPIKLKTVFQNQQGSRAMEGFATIYRQAGGGKAGLDAVDAEFDRLRNAMLSEAEIRESFNRQMKTGQSQAEQFNNQMRMVALEMQQALYPALIALAPAAVEAAKEFTKVITWLTGDKTTSKIVGKATEDVDAAIGSSRVQLKGGKISEAQLAQNQIAEKEAFEAKNRTAAELDIAKKSRMSGTMRSVNKAFDYTPLGAITAWLGGGSYGAGLGTAMNEKEDQDIRAKQLEADKAAKLYQDMSVTNKGILDAINQGLVVKVSNINELRDGAPGNNGNGRTPSPEDKAGR